MIDILVEGTTVNERAEHLIYNRIPVTSRVTAIMFMTLAHAYGLLIHPDSDYLSAFDSTLEDFNATRLNEVMSICKRHLKMDQYKVYSTLTKGIEED